MVPKFEVMSENLQIMESLPAEIVHRIK